MTPLDYANDLALKTLYPSLPGPCAHLSLEVLSLFFLCVCSVAPNSLCCLSLLLIHFLVMGKTLDSFLHPYQGSRPTGEMVSKLSFN